MVRRMRKREVGNGKEAQRLIYGSCNFVIAHPPIFVGSKMGRHRKVGLGRGNRKGKKRE